MGGMRLSMQGTTPDTGNGVGGSFATVYDSQNVRFHFYPSEGRGGDDQRVAVSGDGRLTVLFDGWIANRSAIRAQLESDYDFASMTSDAEIALYAYRLFGNASFDRLDGAFALAIFDSVSDELIIARDRVGQMPLYYQNEGERFRFASQLRSLVGNSDGRPPMNMEALQIYLQLTYIPAPYTIFEGIHKLLAGTYLRITPDGQGEPQVYWDLDYSESNQNMDYELCKSMLRDSLTLAVEEALEVTGRVGALLSGGIDSTIIAGLASRVLDRPLDTFTVSFTDRLYDESSRAAISSALHKTNHHIISMDSSDVLENLDDMLVNLDEPYGDSSYLAAYMVSKAASSQVDTVLTGDSGDELFAGYNKYLIGYYAGIVNKVPSLLSGLAIAFANRLLSAKSHLRRKINKVAESAQLEPFEQRVRLMSLGFAEEDVVGSLSTLGYDAVSNLLRSYYDRYANNMDELRRALYLDFKVVIEGDMMPKGNYASRPFDLSTYVPMLRREVIETAAKIPSQYKIQSRKTKIILKDAFADLIPSKLLMAPKSGFALPLGSWLQRDLRSSIETRLSEERIRDEDILRHIEVRRMMDEHFSGQRDHTSRLWLLHVLMVWLDRWN